MLFSFGLKFFFHTLLDTRLSHQEPLDESCTYSGDEKCNANLIREVGIKRRLISAGMLILGEGNQGTGHAQDYDDSKPKVANKNSVKDLKGAFTH